MRTATPQHCNPRDLRHCLAAIFLLLVLMLVSVLSCQRKDAGQNDGGRKEFWIYTSLYKDTVADLTPRLEKAFPGTKFQWFQAGSEEVAAKSMAEMLSGGMKADLLISSDRLWYDELAQNGKLAPQNFPKRDGVPASFKHPQGLYTTLSHPLMVIGYNKAALGGKKAPTTYKELQSPQWKGLITTGSPLDSGTNFMTVAVLQKKYGWDYFRNLRKNAVLAEGGNSAVLRRLQNKERAVGAILMENILRLQGKDPRIGFEIPTDALILHANVLGIVKKTDVTLAHNVAAWLFEQEGQEAMIRSYMYSPFEGMPAPAGAPPLSQIKEKAFDWSPQFIESALRERHQMKETYAHIMME